MSGFAIGWRLPGLGDAGPGSGSGASPAGGRVGSRPPQLAAVREALQSRKSLAAPGKRPNVVQRRALDKLVAATLPGVGVDGEPSSPVLNTNRLRSLVNEGWLDARGCHRAQEPHFVRFRQQIG